MESLIIILVVLVLAVVAGIFGYNLWRRRERELEYELATDDEPADLYAELDEWEIRRVDRSAGQALDDAVGDGRDDGPDMGDLAGLRADPEDHDPRHVHAPAGRAAPGGRRTVAGSRERPAARAPRPPADDMLIVALSLIAPAGEPYGGPDLLRAFDEVGLVFGDMNIFHHFGMSAAPSRIQVFSVASVVEPGSFDPGNMDDFSTPGLAMFMQLPGPVDGQVGLELMLNTGQRLKESLGGELKDERRSVLTQQTIAHLRERITEFNRRRLVTAG